MFLSKEYQTNFEVEDDGYTAVAVAPRSFTAGEKEYSNLYSLYVEQNGGREPEENREKYWGGCLGYHPHFLNMLLVTGGVMKFAEKHSAYWLIDVIESYGRVSNIWNRVKGHDVDTVGNPGGLDSFIICHLIKTGKSSAVFTMDIERDGGNVTVVYQEIPYTDIDVDSLTVWVEDGIILFPEER